MPLTSRWFRQNERLQNCLISDAAHVLTGTKGDHVSLIQDALAIIEESVIAEDERTQQLYGKSTAQAVLAFKTKRSIINHTYQSAPDNVVGKMTIAALDAEMAQREKGRARVLLAFGVREEPLGIVVAQSHILPKTWAGQMEKAHSALLRRRMSLGATPEQAVKGLQTIVREAGSSGLLIFAVGHGISATEHPASGGFDLADHAVLRIGGIGSERDLKTFVNVFYADKPANSPKSLKQIDQDLRPAGSARRLKNFALFEQLCATFRETKPLVVLLTCRIGKSRDFLQKVSNLWQSPIVAYTDFVTYEGTEIDGRLKTVRAIFERDKGKLGSARPGTNTRFAETMIPVSFADMALFFPATPPKP